MNEDREIPAAVTAWLRDKRIPLGTDELTQTTTQIWAEWDSFRGVLYLGWWGELECPRCVEDERRHWRPLVPPVSGSWSWEHRCGQWWEPDWTAVRMPPGFSDEVIRDALDVALGSLHGVQDRKVERITVGLMHVLHSFLSTSEEQRAAAPKGSDTEPGVWHNGTEWEVWLYDPRDGESTITVTESDITKVAARGRVEQAE